MFKNKKNEEKKEEEKYPEVCTGALIINKEGRVLLSRSPKWDGKYIISGGHLKYGEGLEEGVKREIKEETGLEIKKTERLSFDDAVFDSKYFQKKHLIFCDFLCYYDGNSNDVKTNEEFEKEYLWISPEESLKLEIQEESKRVIEKYIEHKKNLEGWKRCQADFENYRKMQDERMKELGFLLKEDMVMQIFPVLDNFQASIEHVPEDQKKSAWVEGMLHIQRQLENVLKDNGITEIEAKEGDKFNPNLHEAIHQESENSKQKSKDKIKKIIQKGYKIGNKVIRAVKVIVE